MKLNWGGKLMIAAILFMGFVISMVVIISKQDMPLVEQDYYERGLNYQKEIDNNANMDTTLRVDLIGTNLEIVSEEAINAVQVKCYRPSNPDLDKIFTVNLLGGKKEVYDLANLDKGKWVISVIWFKGEKEYKFSRDFER